MTEQPEKTPGDRALDLLERMLKNGSWNINAIELNRWGVDDLDGEDAEIEARAIMVAAGRDEGI